MAWLFQDSKQKRKFEALGQPDKCPWAVGWKDLKGKWRSKTKGTQKAAERFRIEKEKELRDGEDLTVKRSNWAQFRAEYESTVMAGKLSSTCNLTKIALNHFERVIKPARVAAIDDKTIEEYTAKRRVEPRRKSDKEGARVSPATINRELRHLKVVLRKAKKWKYLAAVPEIEFEREPERLPTYVGPEQFALLYDACDKAERPGNVPYTAAEWWRGLIVFLYMTGWRVGAALALRWEDIDLDDGTALSRHTDNKGHRDQMIALHPMVKEHLLPLQNRMSDFVFSWRYGRCGLQDDFGTLQTAAGIKPDGAKTRFGFHDLRRGFATMNVDRLTPDALQMVMQHRDYQTTKRYVNMARQMKPVIHDQFTPVLSIRKSG